MIEHVSVRHKAICLYTLDTDAEDTACYHHADFGVLLQGELAVVWHLVTNRVIVLLNVANFLADLVLEGATF